MEYFQAQHPQLDADPGEMRLGRRAFPIRNMHYASNISESPGYFKFYDNVLFQNRPRRGRDEAVQSSQTSSETQELLRQLRSTDEEIKRLRAELAVRAQQQAASVTPPRQPLVHRPQASNPRPLHPAWSPPARPDYTFRAARTKSPVQEAALSIFTHRAPNRCTLRPRFN